MRLPLLLTSLLLLLGAGSVSAQLSNQLEQNCITGIPVCHSGYYQPNAYSGFGTINELDNSNQDCLSSGEKNSVWYIINVTISGNFAFVITPNNLSNDYDWAVWDITGGGCPLIYNYNTNTTNPYPPVRCNYSGTPGNTGMTSAGTAPSVGAGGSPFSTTMNVTAGQVLALCVSNFSSSQSGYTLDFSSSTAGIYDTVKPRFQNAASHCGFASNNIDVAMTTPILCSSLAPDGSDFYITPAVPGVTITSASSPVCSISGASTTSFNLTFSNTLPAGTYWLHSQVGTDTNTLIDACGNQQTAGVDSIQFTLTPADPPSFVRLDTPACIKARLILNRGVKCTSIDEDGSNFSVSGPSNVRVIKAVPVNCNPLDNLTDTIDVFFDSSIAAPGHYTITAGSDNHNSFISDTCGLVVQTGISWNVSDRGAVATATPPVLCEPGYANLAVTTSLQPPPPAVSCGINNTHVSGAPVVTQIGTGTDQMTTESAFDQDNKDCRTQMIYKASELLAAGVHSGTITKIAFKVLTKNTTAFYHDFTIKMGCSTDSAYSTSSTTFIPGLQVVYDPKNYYSNEGWNTITLDNPYDWDSSSNLIVEVCYHQESATVGNDVLEGMPVANTELYNHLNNSAVEGCALSSTGASIATDRPNIQLTHYNPPASNYNIMWDPSAYVYDATSSNTSAYIPQTTIYTATLLDRNYCYRRDTTKVTVSIRHPKLSPLDTFICINDKSVQLNASGGVTYAWYPANGLSCTTCPDPLAMPDTTTTYHVGIYDQYDCGDTLATKIKVNPRPVLHVSVTDTSVTYHVPFTVYAMAGGSEYFEWTPNVGIYNPYTPSPTIMPDSNIIYTVSVIDTNGCTSSDSLIVHVSEPPVEIPSAFTPNNDGKNDKFRVANLTTQHVIEFRVFNRWGQQVYDGADNDNEGWDGTYNGTPQDMGNYSYMIRMIYYDGKEQTFTGNVTLIR